MSEPGRRAPRGLLYLVRHGETVGRSSLRFFGRTDVPLSDEGRAQARALRRAIAGVRFDRAFSSALSRAVETAAILLEGTGLGARALDALDEVDFGRLEGLTDEEVAARLPEFHRLWRAERRAEGFPGGETFEALFERVAAGMACLESAGALGGTVLFVAHRGSIRAAVAHLLGVPRREARPLALPLAGCFRLEANGGPWRLLPSFLPAGQGRYEESFPPEADP